MGGGGWGGGQGPVSSVAALPHLLMSPASPVLLGHCMVSHIHDAQLKRGCGAASVSPLSRFALSLAVIYPTDRSELFTPLGTALLPLFWHGGMGMMARLSFP